MVNKANLLAGTLTVTAFRGLVVLSPTAVGPYTPQGVNNDDPSATVGYFIGSDVATYGLLQIRRVTNPGGIPSISGNVPLTVPTTNGPINQVAKGSTHPLAAIDTRLFGAMIKKSDVGGCSCLWTAAAISTDTTGVVPAGVGVAGSRNAMRWYQIDNLATTPTLTQSGTLFDATVTNPIGYWMGSVAANGQGHMALVASAAGTNSYASIAVAGRLSGDTLGTTQAPTIAIASTSAYNTWETLAAGAPQRWGDYSKVVVDPTDDQTMWAFIDYGYSTVTTDAWAVGVVKLLAPPPATPSSASVGTVPAATASTSITITGTSSSGSGFFDPGSGFTNRISATVSGGVTVNSVTYVSPTSVTLNLSTVGATNGVKNVTITNPDGQQAIGNALFTVGSVVPGDFNGDGHPDLVFRNVVSGANVAWYMNGITQVGSAYLPTLSDTNWRLVATPDMNSDGSPDLVFRNVVTGANQIYFMNGTALSSAVALSSVPDVTWEMVGAADLDGDGHPDLLWRNRITGADAVWYMNGATLLSVASLPTLADVTWQLVAVGDLDGDGHPDFVWRNAATDDAAVWFMNKATISSIVSLPKVADPNWQIVGAVDLNGDGRADLVWHNTFSGDTAFWYMNGATLLSVVSAPRLSDTTWALAGQTVRAPSDFNLDGHPDLVWRNYATGANAAWYMNGTTQVGSAYLPTLSDTNWHLVATADLNGDGWPDLIWRNAATGANMAWFMNGTAVAAVVTLPSVPDTTWDLVATADLDGDGHPDFLWHNRVTCANAIWYMQDGATIKSAGIVALPTVGDPNWHLMAAADLDGDGHPDLIWRNVVTGDNAVWHMNNATILSIAMLPPVGDTNYDLVGAFDVNGDGKPDIVWRNRVTGGNVVWYLNDVSVTGAAALPAFIADFNWRIGR